MAKTRDVNEIRFHPDEWAPTRPRRTRQTVCGFDTETDKGWAFLLTISTPTRDRAVRVDSFDDFLAAVYKREFMGSVNWFQNMGFDFSALAKHMGERHLRDLARADFTVWKGTEVRVIPDKAFTLNMFNTGEKSHRECVTFYDLAQFYGYKSLKEIGRIVGVPKLEFDTAKGVSKQRFLKDAVYRDRLTTYALRDARICRLGGERLHRAVNSVVPVNQYYSPATIAQAFFLSQLDGKEVRRPPKYVTSAALMSYAGGRFEIVRRGHFPKVWGADINSAYPHQFAQLPATGTKTGRWKKTTSPDPEALLGFYRVRVRTHDSLLSPLIFRSKSILLYPHGQHETWVEKSELELCQRMGFRVKVLEGCEYADPEPVYPFRFIETSLYPKRLQLKMEKEEALEAVYKIILNSSYGKTIQMVPWTELVAELPEGTDPLRVVREVILDDGSVLMALRMGWKAGKLFAPVYASAITARVRARLVTSVLDHGLEKSLIGFATDSIYTDRKPPEALLGDGLGSWKLEVDGREGLFVGSGVYAVKKEGHPINHIRGFDTKRDLFDAVTKGILTFIVEQPVKLKEGVRGCVRDVTGRAPVQVDWTKIATWLPQEKRLDLDFDRKRKWARRVTCPEDLLRGVIDSVPLQIQDVAPL